MEPVSKPYAALAVLAPASVLAFGLLRGWDWFSLLYAGIILFSCIPIVCSGLCMWFHGSGYRFLNIGIDWRSLDEKASRETASRWGFWLAAGTAALIWACAAIMRNIAAGLILMAVSIALMLVPLAGGMARRSPLPGWGRTKRAAVAIVFVLAAAVPFAMITESEYGSMNGSVDVSVGEDSFSVKAPFFDRSFSYDEIGGCEYFEDFPKGKRIMGYSDGTLSSGRYSNSIFGSYELASYSKVRPCIAVSVGGEMYAFNQSSDTLTESLYETLKEKISAA